MSAWVRPGRDDEDWVESEETARNSEAEEGEGRGRRKGAASKLME